jgi:hypothetical protein
MKVRNYTKQFKTFLKLILKDLKFQTLIGKSFFDKIRQALPIKSVTVGSECQILASV